MEWKKAYAKACVDAIQPKGDVLAIGFGEGYAAAYIQVYHPASLTIVESDPAVVRQALEWAVAFPEVTIVSDTWQRAFRSLGKFDAIYFGERFSIESADPKHANILVRAGKALIENVFKKFTRLREIRYTDADVDFFLRKLENKSAEDKKMLPRFFGDLYQQGQITQLQWENVCTELQRRGWISEKEIAHRQAITRDPIVNSSGLCDFLKQCVDKHMNKGARFSCYMENPTSKFEDPTFQEQVVLNPNLDYSEQWIDLTRSLDYPFDQALVITVTIPE